MMAPHYARRVMPQPSRDSSSVPILALRLWALRLGAVRAAACLMMAAGAFGAPASASDLAFSAYSAGRYLDAANSAERVGAADDLAFAARAILAKCMADPQSRSLALVTRAEQAARRALALDPSSVEARLQLAIAIGLKARQISTREAIAADYVGQGRRLFEEALARAPENPWAHAVKGAWNLEIVRRAPDFAARMIGASTASGIQSYERALALAPNDPAIAYQYGLALLATNAARHRARARAALERAVSAPAASAFDRSVQGQAATLLEAIYAENETDIDRLVAAGLS